MEFWCIHCTHEGNERTFKGRDFEVHKNWVFNTHPDKVPSFKELMRAALIALVRCCTKKFYCEEKKKSHGNEQEKEKKVG